MDKKVIKQGLNLKNRTTGSLKGWSFWEWFKGNWSWIKEAAKFGLPAFLGWIATKDPVWTIVVMGLGKITLDIIHYYIKEKQ